MYDKQKDDILEEILQEINAPLVTPELQQYACKLDPAKFPRSDRLKEVYGLDVCKVVDAMNIEQMEDQGCFNLVENTLAEVTVYITNGGMVH